MADFNSLPFPMQLMQMRQMQAQMRQEQAMRQARGQAGQVLYDQMGAGAQPQGIPQPPPGPGPQAPSPGSMSPGGGNPMAQGGASVMAPPQAGPQMGSAIPPPPAMQAGAQPAQQPAPQAPAAAMPQQIPPFRPLPSAAYTPQGGLAPEVPPPPGAAEPAAPAAPAVKEPNPLDLKGIIVGLQRSGIKPDQVMNMLDTLAPVMNSQNKMELNAAKLENQALREAALAYARVKQADAAETRATTGVTAETRRADQGQQRIDNNARKEARLKAQAAAAAGGGAGLKTTELVYPKGANGQPDQTQAPIGVRAVTKTGKIINLNAEGHQVPTLAGATAREGRASQVNVRDTVRGNLVEGSALNAINRLKEIEETHPAGTTSLLFGRSADGVLSGAGHAAMRGTQSADQQDIDAKWSSFIDEAIPVFTGGLRGSDAFRRFLIEQAPQPNTKPEVIKEKMRLFRENIRGTQRAFANKFAADPQMWGPGVTPEQARAAAAGVSRGTALPAGIPQGSSVIGKTPDGRDVYKAPDGKNYTAD